MAKELSVLAPKVVLGIAAHPDDLDFRAGGTICKYARAGADVYFLILTDGARGSKDRSLAPEQLAKIRQEEQTAACKALGVKEVFFTAYGDCQLENIVDVRRDIVRSIRRVRPDVVITWDPTMVYAASADMDMINHPDHRAAGQATLDAVYPLARDHLSFPELLEEGLEPHKTPTVLLINFNQHNYAEDIRDTLDAKLQAVAKHLTQASDLEDKKQMVRGWAAAAGKTYGLQSAEAFMRIDIV